MAAEPLYAMEQGSLVYFISLLKANRDKKKKNNKKLAVSVTPCAAFPPGLSLLCLFIYKVGCHDGRCFGRFVEWEKKFSRRNRSKGGFSAPETANIYRRVCCDT